MSIEPEIIEKLIIAKENGLESLLLNPNFGKKVNDNNDITKNKYTDRPICPSCESEKVIFVGYQKSGHQRCKCKDCGKSFMKNVNTILEGTKKDLMVWELFIDCTIDGLSIRKTAEICNINRNTADVWRKKLIYALSLMNYYHERKNNNEHED